MVSAMIDRIRSGISFNPAINNVRWIQARRSSLLFILQQQYMDPKTSNTKFPTTLNPSHEYLTFVPLVIAGVASHKVLYAYQSVDMIIANSIKIRMTKKE